jgi:Lipocalin-like domain
MTSDPLVGTWRLISWENRAADGRISYPVGTAPLGYIIYSEHGYMFVAIMRRNRPSFSAGDLLRGTPEEKVQAAETYVSYCGKYDFRGETVVHHVELSLFPNWVGVDQERLVEVTANRLTLSTRPTLLDGIEQTARLVWERA